VLLRVTEVRGSRVLALDGMLGKVRDIYFDDTHWIARYLVIDAGRWLATREVLITPQTVKLIDRTLHAVLLSLPRVTVQVSPPVASDESVWGQLEVAYHRATDTQDDAHLRSAKEVTKYCVGALDGRAGRVRDFLFDEETWSLRYLVVEQGLWPFAHQVMLACEHVQEINWGAQCVNMDLTRAQMRGATEFDPEALPRGDVAVDSSRVVSAQRARTAARHEGRT